MKVSWNWLEEFVDLADTSPEEVAKKLTFAGVEVDEIKTLAKGNNLVIGQVLSSRPHPDSDHLHVLSVDEGKKLGIHQIVCGAPNVKEGLKVIVAREGASLPEVTIARSKIRGVESDGMCCSLLELGVERKNLSEEQIKGIEELPDDAPVGEEDVLGYLGLDDTVIELELLANRSDLNAMENVAREVETLLQKKATIKDYSETKSGDSAFLVGSKTAKCPLFGAREIRGITIKPSPNWLKHILASSGVRSINNVVDIGNFVMLLTGQPINMYDADKIKGGSLIVREDFEGPFIAMDDKNYDLKIGDLVVMDGDTPMCLAGIMTSQAAQVTPLTKNVIIEAASFLGSSIRKTSNRIGLASESSSRFVKGLNPNQNERVLRICSFLMKELCEAKEILAAKTYDVLDHKTHHITTSSSYINSRLGTNFPQELIVKTLERDGMKVSLKRNDEFEVEVPSFRIDITQEADLSEEVIRLLGFDNIESRLPPLEAKSEVGYSEGQKKRRAIRRFLKDNGVSECITYSLTNAKDKDGFDYLSQGECYKLLNPLTDEREYLRKSLLPSLLRTAEYNFAHQAKDLSLFEISDIETTSYSSKRLALVLVGEEQINGSLKKASYDFYSVKGYFEAIVSLLGLSLSRFKMEPLNAPKEEFHPARSVLVRVGKDPIAVFGEIHPSLSKELGLGKSKAVALEMDLKTLMDMKSSLPKASIPPRFPSVSRDLAFLVKKDVAYDSLRKEITHLDKSIQSVELFDVYEGSNISPLMKSLALTITFVDENKTLKDEEVALCMKKIVDALKMKFNIEVRS